MRPREKFLVSAIFYSACLANAATYTCRNNPADPAHIQAALNAGGSQVITGTCSMGNKLIKINRPVSISGGATFVTTARDIIWQINSDDVTFKGLTFAGTFIEAPGIPISQRSNVNFIDNTFRDYLNNGQGQVILISPIHRNSRITGNTFLNIWYGGFINTTKANICSLGGIGMCNPADQNLLVHAFVEGGGVDNVLIEYNRFNQISGNGVKLFASGNTSNAGGYTGQPLSVSYNTFENLHRIAIELQASSGSCPGGCNWPRPTVTRLKIAGNYFLHPAYPWTELYAYSLPLYTATEDIINNAAIADDVNPDNVLNRLGYAFEANPGTAADPQPPGGGRYVGNLVSGDPLPSSPPSWYEAVVTYNPPAKPVHYHNNVFCGPANNTSTRNFAPAKANQIQEYNYISSACPGGFGPGLYTSNLVINSLKSSGSQSETTLRFAALSNLPIRYVQFFLDGANVPIATQEIADVNPNFSNDRKWLYHVELEMSSLLKGSHTLLARATDVSGVTQSVTQPFSCPR